MNAINLLTISGEVTLRCRDRLPDKAGIYFIYDEKERLLYIGQAKSLQKRWVGKSHHRYKQFSCKGLDKILIKYILTSVGDLDELEAQYIKWYKPSLNDTKVQEYFPKKSLRYSELQRLLKLINTPLFPSYKKSYQDGQVIPRESSDLIRGFLAGVYQEEKTHILVVCRQNIGDLVYRSYRHRNKKRFYLETDRKALGSGYYYYFDARTFVFNFLELYDMELSSPVFHYVYPSLLDYEIAEVTVKALFEPALLISCLKEHCSHIDSYTKDYILKVGEKLQPMPTTISLNKDLIW